MKFSTALLGISLFTLSLTSCKEKKGDNEIEDGTAGIIDNYLPTTEGSWWLFNSTNPASSQYKREATGIDSLQDGLRFRYFTYTPLSTMDADPEYFGKFDGTDYYTLFNFGTPAEPKYFRAIVMKDDPFVGMSWVNTGSINYGIVNVDMEVTCQILTLTDAITTADTTFTNAIKLHGKLRAKTSVIPWGTYGTVYFWFVPNVGIVKQEFDISLPAGLYTKKHIDELVEYHIAP